MATLLLTFPGGRYHATPGGHHVNEGLIEWPPSPWRIVRALVATGYATQQWQSVPEVGRRLVEALSEALPRYRLPRGALAHTRHYMPPAATLVYDAFADVGQGTLSVRWPASLDAEAQSLFERLARHLGYLGRSESWVLGQSVADDAPLPEGLDAYPHDGVMASEPGWEQVSIDAPVPAVAYAKWRADAVEKALAELPLPATGKIPKKLLTERNRAEAPYPKDLVACLEQDTAGWKAHRWSAPPGSRKVLYWRRVEGLSIGASTGAPPVGRQIEVPRATGVLLAITTESGNRSALPPVARTVPQAELIHRALVSRVGHGKRVSCPEIIGRDRDGRLLEGHRHVHTLPLDLDADGHLDHVLLYAPMGFGTSAQRAIRELRRTWTKGGSGDLQLAVAGDGEPDDLRRLPESLVPAVTRLLGPLGGARRWTSATPFVLPRHQKADHRGGGRHTLEGQVQSELASRNLPSAKIEVLPFAEQPAAFRNAIRVRAKASPRPPVDHAFALRLTFEEPQRGPICLGYAAHFGNGRFDAEA
jgi:CRISPR-associated protein Csb2